MMVTSCVTDWGIAARKKGEKKEGNTGRKETGTKVSEWVKERRLGRKISEERQGMTFECCTERTMKTRRQVKGNRKAGKKRQPELKKDGIHVVYLKVKRCADGTPKIPVTIKTVEFHLSGRWLSGHPIIRIGLALPVNLSRILQN